MKTRSSCWPLQLFLQSQNKAFIFKGTTTPHTVHYTLMITRLLSQNITQGWTRWKDTNRLTMHTEVSSPVLTLFRAKSCSKRLILCSSQENASSSSRLPAEPSEGSRWSSGLPQPWYHSADFTNLIWVSEKKKTITNNTLCYSMRSPIQFQKLLL